MGDCPFKVMFNCYNFRTSALFIQLFFGEGIVLAKELKAHLKGGKTKVAPERLVRAFEMIGTLRWNERTSTSQRERP